MILKLSELFIPDSKKQVYTKQELFMLKLNSNFIKNMEDLLHISYLKTTTFKVNLCFENNNEVQPEFRTVFTKTDIIFYVNTFLNKDILNIETDTIQLPHSKTNFWEMVKKGR